MPRSVFAAAAFLLATTGAGATAAGTPAGDPAVGEAVAGMICARCHDIASSTRPGSQPRVPAKPPAFVDIAQDPTRTAA